MTQIRFTRLQCNRALAKLDSFLDNELPGESHVELRKHLQRCPSCLRELAARRNVRAQLQAAVRQVQVPSGLERRVRDRLRRTPRPPGKLFNLMAIAAVVAVCFGS